MINFCKPNGQRITIALLKMDQCCKLQLKVVMNDYNYWKSKFLVIF